MTENGHFCVNISTNVIADYKCRDIVCYPGRVLINGKCIPLLPYTANLNYTLTFGIIMLIFTTLSLLCLFLTFMTYCMFEQLRALPGKNNMCLVVALFFAMAVLEFGMKSLKLLLLHQQKF
ncbi:uncharacterized protein LOC143078585 [Mytilus galloprovincialis]|uniref:uncharacterized protein LOC143078585 n=1 Tax=Mytilus galloprovincialis TaxID=29158 RepID=UPI003F7C3CD1